MNKPDPGRRSIFAIFLLLICSILLAIYCNKKEPSGLPPTTTTTPPPVDRIKAVAKEGRTYKSLVKARVESQIIDKNWGIQEIVYMAYLAEMAITRQIEKNDGDTIVEVRSFDIARAVKIDSKVEISLKLGPVGTCLLGALATFQPELTGGFVVLAPVVKAIAENGGQLLVDQSAAKAWGHMNSLAGKQVRITYIVGKGVSSVEPIGCNLTSEEKGWIYGTAVLSDYYVMPQIDCEPGDKWAVDGAQLAGLIDPELRGRPKGQIVLRRGANFNQNNQRHAELEVDSGYLLIDRSDESDQRIGTFTPRGELKFSLDDQYVASANLSGDASFEEVSKDHLLFETVHKVKPTVTIQYSCRIE
jgi:hypothetical protein